jgi:hypothetical protein
VPCLENERCWACRVAGPGGELKEAHPLLLGNFIRMQLGNALEDDEQEAVVELDDGWRGEHHL